MVPPDKKQKTGSHQQETDEACKDPEFENAKDKETAESQGHSPREITRDALQSEGWRIPEVSDDMRRCYVPHSRRIVSPLMPLKSLKDEWLQVVNDHVHIGVRRLFHEIRADAEHIKTIMLGLDAISDEGNSPYLCISGDDGEPNVINEPGEEPGLCAIPIPGLLAPQSSRDRTPSFEGGNVDKHLYIRRIRNIRSKATGYFVVNLNLENLAINESAVSPNLIAGPLPDFALLTIGSIAVFWWRTKSAWDYSPGHHSILKRAIDLSLLTDIPQTLTEKDRRTSNKSWEEILQERLARHTREYSLKLAKPDPYRVQVRSTTNMNFPDVWLAIGSIWAGLRKLSTPVVNAYAQLERFNYQESSRDLYPAAGAGRRFIIPLFFLLGTEFDVGHIMLAVARLEDEADKQQIQVEFYDSLPGIITNPRICQRTMEIIRDCRWPNPSDAESQLIPSYTKSSTPRQQPGSNTCGMYAILNAWAVMLGIPVSRNRRRRGLKSHEEFAKMGTRIINFALVGCMDSRTIQAFMNVYGYSAPQRPENPADYTAHAVKAKAMWKQQLDQYLTDLVGIDQGIEFVRESASPDEPNVPPALRFPAEDIERVVQFTVTREEAIQALQNSRGDVNDAVLRVTEAGSENAKIITQPDPPNKSISTVLPNDAGTSSATKFPPDDINTLMLLGATEDEAVEALRKAGGNLDNAGRILYKSPSNSPADTAQPGPSGTSNAPSGSGGDH